MVTINTIIKEMKDVPVERLEEVYELVHSLNTKTKAKNNSRKKILSFAGVFSDMSDKEYEDFKSETKKIRNTFLDRDSTL